MNKNSFFQTKAGGLTIAFLVTFVAFIIGLVGVNTDNQGLSVAAFVLIVLAMLYSPFKVYFVDRFKKK